MNKSSNIIRVQGTLFFFPFKEHYSCSISWINEIGSKSSPIFRFVKQESSFHENYAVLLAKEEQTRAKQGPTSWDFISLSTDSDYQDRIYSRLLTTQKNINTMMSLISVTTFMHHVHPSPVHHTPYIVGILTKRTYIVYTSI